jgi:hypothetical protein
LTSGYIRGIYYFQGFGMLEYDSSVRRKPVLAKIAGLLLPLTILFRVLSSFVSTEKAFWACFFLWAVLPLIEYLSSVNTGKFAGAESNHGGSSREKPEFPIWSKAFGPLAAFNLITIFLGLWPLGGFGILLWLISWFVYDFIESSRLGRRGLPTLSLR